MGVQGLWTIAHPCARPTALESLSRKRLAVDASIWIYQFLKAVRDSEGHALRNAHVVGFFRRVCKLLFFGIRPVFVFDGGAPALKRGTIAGRKGRREERREDAKRTAGRILALQVQRVAEGAVERSRKGGNDWDTQVQGEQVEGVREGEELVYVDELLQTPRERMENKRRKGGFHKADPYHLPDLDVSLESMGAPNDPRVMSQEDLEEYARQFRGGEEINLYDFSKIDFDSPFFKSLPAADRYNILNAARLRSRMRMGLAKEQLDAMFPDRMDFSRFQIERVAERNSLTQRLMNLNGMNDGVGVFDPTRVAGEKGREYVLVKNEGVEGGWALGVVGHTGEREGERNKPIVVDVTEKVEDDDVDDDDDDFEDVPIEGLNRLPHLGYREEGHARGGGAYDAFDDAEAQMLRQALYESRKEQSGPSIGRGPPPNPILNAGLFDPNNPLFLDDEDYEGNDDPFPLDEVDEQRSSDGEQLQRAIQMSLQPSRAYNGLELESAFFGRDLSDIEEVEEEEEVIGKGKGRAVEKPRLMLQQRDILPAPPMTDRDEDMDFRRALSESRRVGGGGGGGGGGGVKPSNSGWNAPGESSGARSSANPFGGLLPFEPLSLGSKSFLTKKKPEEKQKEKGAEREEEKPVPLPPWFLGGVEKDLREEMRKANRVEEVPFEKEVVTVYSEDEGPRNDSDQEMEMFLEPAVSQDQREPMPGADSLPFTSVEMSVETQEDSDQELDWEESDHEDAVQARRADLQRAAILQPHADSIPSPPPPDFSVPEVEPPQEMTPPLEVEEDEYADPEDLELIQQLAQESEEHARFAAELNNRPQQLRQTHEEYERELKTLRTQQAKDRRDADEVTQVMIQECQQLLKLFGIPYITAPMEAEAQCAELIRLGLVDGIVTDDSDTFLFGGTRVYKNMFNQSKFVECYLASDLEKEFALDRGRLIRIAHLLGSDYTEGVPNVGPVTALELLAEFSSDDGLAEFKDWWTAVQTGLRKPSEDAASKFRKKFRKNATKIFLPPNFPDPRVDDAYLNPEVDRDPSPFEWGVPDLDGLRDFLMVTVGWSQERTDEVLVPVIKDMNRKQMEGTQRNITQFFEGGTGAGAWAPRKRVEGKSKRMEKAMLSLHEQAKRRAGHVVEEDEDGRGGEQEAVEKPAKRKRAPARKKKKLRTVSSDDDDGGDEEYIEEAGKDAFQAPPKKRKTAARKSRRVA